MLHLITFLREIRAFFVA